MRSIAYHYFGHFLMTRTCENCDKDEILKILLTGSDNQLDPPVKQWIGEIIGLPDDEQKTHLKTILDNCVAGAMCTDFVVSVLDFEWRKRGGEFKQKDKEDS